MNAQPRPANWGALPRLERRLESPRQLRTEHRRAIGFFPHSDDPNLYFHCDIEQRTK